MISVAPAVFLGTTVSERVVLLARIPEDAPEGQLIRALHLLTSEDYFGKTTDYIAMRIGRINNGRFDGLGREIPLDGTLTANVVRRYELSDPVIVARSQILCLKLSMRGEPPPLAEASIVVEWGIHASRRSARG